MKSKNDGGSSIIKMIGLLSPYAVNNYGTKLQAFAVQEIFSEYDETEIINYCPGFIDKVFNRTCKTIHPVKAYKDVVTDQTDKKISPSLEAQRIKAISSFDSYLKTSSLIKSWIALSKRSNSYKAVVCGSDQIWNPYNINNNVFMLEFVSKKVRRIALAPSFGVTEIPTRLKQVYKRKISNIEYLSVRELSGCEIVRQLGREDVFLSLDPTLILNPSKWWELSQKSKYHYSEPYIFCYFLGVRSLGREIASIIREKTGYKIVNLPHFKTFAKCDEDFADIDLYDVSPIDFIGLISNAQYVVTDSFHGTAFSTIFRKDFYCVSRHDNSLKENTNDRIASLLQFLKLDYRIVKGKNDISNWLEPIVWDNAQSILDHKRLECKHFIEKALGGSRNNA